MTDETMALSIWRGDMELPRVQSMKNLLESTAQAHGLTAAELLKGSRERSVAYARHEFMWRCRQVRRLDGSWRFSLPRIGAFLGGMDHTSVRHGVIGHQRRLDEAAEGLKEPPES